VSSERSEIVQVTPRSVQIARSTPRRTSWTPIASAHLVQPVEEDAAMVRAVHTISAVAVVAVPVSGPLSCDVRVAQAAAVRR
jgi:hypothetical protein